jgi:hypothetical protein
MARSHRRCPCLALQLRPAIDKACKRGFEGFGSPGTKPMATVRVYRIIAGLSQVAAVIYILWRALRSLGEGKILYITVPIWLAEFLSLVLGAVFVMGLWYVIERPPRVLNTMLHADDFPYVDVFVVCYSEPVEVGGRGGERLCTLHCAVAARFGLAMLQGCCCTCCKPIHTCIMPAWQCQHQGRLSCRHKRHTASRQQRSSTTLTSTPALMLPALLKACRRLNSRRQALAPCTLGCTARHHAQGTLRRAHLCR